jgi:hypothetical protein
MENLFDELAKCLSGHISRRKALKRCGALLAGAVGVSFGLHGRAWADHESAVASCIEDCCHGLTADARMDCNNACQAAVRSGTAVCRNSTAPTNGTCAFCTTGQTCSSTGTCTTGGMPH